MYRAHSHPDALIGVGSRAAFDAAYAAAWEGTERRIALVLMDLDHLKSINDAFGHQRGDQALRTFVERAAACADPDTLFRFGGDEFALLLPGVGPEEARVVAERACAAIRAAPLPGEPPVFLSASIGVASYPEDATDGESLFREADRRLYAAKRGGRARVVAGADDEQRQAELPARLMGYEQERETCRAVLESLPGAGRGVLRIAGPRGSGRTRILQELGTLAALQGLEVVRAVARPVLRPRALGAIYQADPELAGCAEQSTAACVRSLEERLALNGMRGLLVLVDDLEYLDEESSLFLQRLLVSRGGPPVALAYTVESAAAWSVPPFAASLGEEVHLEGVPPELLRSWVRGQLHWDPPDPLVRWLHVASGGLLGRAEAALVRLRREGYVRQSPEGYEVDDEFISRIPGPVALPPRAIPAARIPAVTTTLVGRNRELLEIRRRLGAARLVTLLGPGGVGKTRLCQQVALEEADRGERVYFVPLAHVTAPGLVAAAIADQMDIDAPSEVDPVGRLADALGGGQALVVLDNFEHVMDAAPLLGELLLRAPGVRILVTSRERLGLGEEDVVEVDGVTVPPADDPEGAARAPAVRLLLQRSLGRRSELPLSPEDLAAAVQICRMLGGVPLALELAAALARTLPFPEVAGEITRSLDVLQTRMRDVPERHRSLRGVFDYSWALLSPAEREALSALSLFRSGFTRVAAERITGAHLPTLAALLDKALLRRSASGRYDLHEIFRRFAGERLAEDPARRARLRDTYVRYYLDLSARLGRGVRGAHLQGALAEAGEEIGNLVGALHLAVRAVEEPEARTLVELLTRFFELRGWNEEGERVLGRAARRAPAGSALRARLLTHSAHFCTRMARFEEARRRHLRAIRLARDAGAPEVVARARFHLAFAHLQTGAFPVAGRLYRQALRGFRDAGDLWLAARCLGDLGNIAVLRGDLPRAERRLRLSLELRERLGDLSGMATCLNNLGTVLDLQGDATGARRAFERCLAAARESGNRSSAADALHNLGVFTRRQAGDPPAPELAAEAEDLLRQALDVFRAMGARDHAAMALHNLADLEQARGRLPQALALFRTALAQASETGAVPYTLSVLGGVARALAPLEPERAARWAALAAAHAASPTEARERAEALLRGLRGELGHDAVAAARAQAAGEVELAREVAAALETLDEALPRAAAGRDAHVEMNG